MRLTIIAVLFCSTCLVKKGYSQEDTKVNYADSLKKKAPIRKSYFIQSSDTTLNSEGILKHPTTEAPSKKLKTTVPEQTKRHSDFPPSNVFGADSVLNRNFKKEN